MEFNVHAAELIGIHLALKEWLGQPTLTTTCQIYTDSLAAGASLNNCKRPLAQSLVKNILDIIDSVPPDHQVQLT